MTEPTKTATPPPGWLKRLAEAIAVELGAKPGDAAHGKAAEHLYKRLQSLRGRTKDDDTGYDRLRDRLAEIPEGDSGIAKLALEVVPLIALLALEEAVERRLTEGGMPFNVSFASIRKAQERFKGKDLFQPAQMLAMARHDALGDPAGAKTLELHVQTLFSALNAGGGAPSPANPPAPNPTPETPTMEPLPLTTEAFIKNWKASFAFAPFGLPETLKAEAGKQAFVTAVAQAVDLFGVANGGHLAAILTSAMLADGRYDPKAPGFYDALVAKHAQLSRPSGYERSSAGDPDDVPDPASKALVFHVHQKAMLRLAAKAGGPVFFQQVASAGEKASQKAELMGDDLAFNQVVDEGASSWASGGGNGSSLGRIELPPLGDGGGSSSECQPEGLVTAAKIYCGLQLEQMGFFKCIDRMVDVFMAGLLPLPYDESSRLLDEHYWNRSDRLSADRRAALFSRVLGAPGLEDDGMTIPNAEFGPRLIRFVTSLHRVFTEVDYFRPFSDLQEYVRKSGRDLASNVSLYSWAGTHFDAERLTHQINDGLKLISLPSVKSVYGVTTPWQVLERISQQEFGTTVNVVKHRTLADETRAILEIIAKYPQAWGDSSGDLLTIDYNRTGMGGVVGGVTGSGVRVGAIDLVDTERLRRAAQYWLAVNGVKDQQVDEYSEPTDLVASPSLPYASGREEPSGLNGAAAIRDMVGSGRMPSMDELRNAFNIAV